MGVPFISTNLLRITNVFFTLPCGCWTHSEINYKSWTQSTVYHVVCEVYLTSINLIGNHFNLNVKLIQLKKTVVRLVGKKPSYDVELFVGESITYYCNMKQLIQNCNKCSGGWVLGYLTTLFSCILCVVVWLLLYVLLYSVNVLLYCVYFIILCTYYCIDYVLFYCVVIIVQCCFIVFVCNTVGLLTPAATPISVNNNNNNSLNAERQNIREGCGRRDRLWPCKRCFIIRLGGDWRQSRKSKSEQTVTESRF
jgi:hypothetical protein